MKKAENLHLSLLDERLLDAVISNHPNSVESLIEQGANPNCFEDKCQIRPLHFAAVYDAMDVVYPLIKAGAKIDAQTSDGCKPIDIAKQLNHSNVVEVLKTLSTNVVSLY